MTPTPSGISDRVFGIGALLGLLAGCALAQNVDTSAKEEKEEATPAPEEEEEVVDTAGPCVITGVPIAFDSGALIPDGDGVLVDLFIANTDPACDVPKADWYAQCPERGDLPTTGKISGLDLTAGTVTHMTARVNHAVVAGDTYGCNLFYSKALADQIELVSP